MLHIFSLKIKSTMYWGQIFSSSEIYTKHYWKLLHFLFSTKKEDRKDSMKDFSKMLFLYNSTDHEKEH